MDMELWVGGGLFLEANGTWRQSLSTLEAALVWTLSSFDGHTYFKKCLDLPSVGEKITEWQNVLWYDSDLSFVDVYPSSHKHGSEKWVPPHCYFKAGVLAKLMALLISYPLMRGKSLVQASRDWWMLGIQDQPSRRKVLVGGGILIKLDWGLLNISGNYAAWQYFFAFKWTQWI